MIIVSKKISLSAKEILLCFEPCTSGYASYGGLIGEGIPIGYRAQPVHLGHINIQDRNGREEKGENNEFSLRNIPTDLFTIST